MNQEHLAVLFRVEVRRQWKAMLRIWVGTLVLAIATAVWDVADSGFRLALIFGMGIGTSISVPMRVARDKLSGQIDFLVMLPTSTSNLVGARFLAVGAGALLWAVPAGVAVWMADPLPGWTASRSALASGAMFGWWGMLSLLGWVLVALFVRFDLDTLTGWPLLAAVVVYFAGDYAWDAFVPEGAAEWLLGLAQRPWASEAAGVLGLCLFLAIAVAAFLAAEHGLARYTSSEETV